MPRIKQHEPERVVHVIVGNNVYRENVDINNEYDISKLDGLTASNIILDIEDEFNVIIDGKDFKNFKKVGDIVSYVTNKLQ